MKSTIQNRDLIKNRGVISVDFNNYTTPGIWSYDGNQSVSNNPGNVAGNLEVIVSSTYVIQRITAYDREYTRRKSGTTWTKWASYATTSDLDNTVRFVDGNKNNFWTWLNPTSKTLYFYDGPTQSGGANIIGTVKLS